MIEKRDKRDKNKGSSHYNFFPKNRRGSHVEVIISFIIFVTFIFFLFSILEPSIGGQKDKKNLLDSVEVAVLDRVSAEMTTITVRIITSTSQNCIELNDEITNLNIDSRIVSIGSYGNALNCYISSTDSKDLRIERESTSDNLLKIYYSSAFPTASTSSSSCQSLQRGTGYSLGLTKSGSYIFESEMINLINENYENLKSGLKIPEGVSFGYGIILSNGTSLDSTTEELSTNIYIRETPIEYVDLNGNILMGALKIKIW
jgi:hypothetical protein